MSPASGAARMSLVAEVSKPRGAADAAAVADLLESEIVSPDVEDSEGTPVLIVAATLGHAEIVSVLVTAGADPEARLRASICGGGSIGRAVPHLTAQNNFGSSLYYPWETALTVLRHFAGAVNQVGARYDWNSRGVDLDCAAESRALDFLRPRYVAAAASLPGESVAAKRVAMGRMAGVLIANGASCENQANKDHVTCAGPSDSVTVEYGAIPRDQSGGTVIASVVSGGTTPYGTPLTFTAMPAHGWELSAWPGEGDAAECSPSKLDCELTAVSNLRVTALFSRAPSARYAPKPSNGGSVTVIGTDGVDNDVDFVYTGGTVTFTAIPANGWEFSAWQGDADATKCPPSKLDCAVKVNGDLRVTALFSRAPSVWHASEPSGGGSVTVIGTDGVAEGVAEGADFVYTGGTVTFTAIPANGWELSVWAGDAASCPASEWDCELVANGDLRVTAIFAPAASVRYASEPSDGGRVTVIRNGRRCGGRGLCLYGGDGDFYGDSGERMGSFGLGGRRGVLPGVRVGLRTCGKRRFAGDGALFTSAAGAAWVQSARRKRGAGDSCRNGRGDCGGRGLCLFRGDGDFYGDSGGRMGAGRLDRQLRRGGRKHLPAVRRNAGCQRGRDFYGH